jgi:subtilisin family serine protease
LSEDWIDKLLESIHQLIDPKFNVAKRVRIAILDSGLDSENSSLIEDQQQDDPRIKAGRSFVHGTESHDIEDKIGHGTHALGLLLKVAPFADIYVAKVAQQDSLDADSYDDIAKARSCMTKQTSGLG